MEEIAFFLFPYVLFVFKLTLLPVFLFFVFQIFLDGVNIRDLNVRWLRAQLGYVGQEPVLFSGSIQSNIIKGRAEAVDVPLLTFHEMLREDKRNDCLPCRRTGDDDEPKKRRGGGAKVIDTGTKEVKRGEWQIRADVETGVSPKGVSSASISDVPDDVLAAATAGNAHSFISDFTDGYDTDVGESSAMVSGGQKQRIAISRALIKRPSVLLLDEATSALDAASEKIVQASIDELQSSKRQTTLIIAHRLTTIVNADKIVVIDQGRVVEQGTHETLLRVKGGLYAHLWAKQQQTSA